MTVRTTQTTRGASLGWRFLVALLLCAIVVALVLLAQPLLRFANERSAYAAAGMSRDFNLVATAIAGDEAAPSSKAAHRPKPVPERPAQILFATNTPQPTPAALPTMPAEAIATPAPESTAAPQATPPPLPTLFIYSGPDHSANAPTAVPTAVTPLDRHGDDLMNILLIGNDGEITADGSLRTDSMIIVSVNRTAGTVSMLSIPRDLFVYIPSWTMQRINTAWSYGESVGWTDGGFGLMRQTLLYNLGINVHHYAMVDLTGFKALVDAVGGVTLSVDCAIQDLPLVDSEVPAGAYPAADEDYWVLPVGSYTMTGGEALWYARSRHNSSDFDRGRRQIQLLRAIWRQANAQGLITQVPELWAQVQPYIQTSLTFEDILSLIPIAASLDPGKIEDFQLVRTYHTLPWQTPDGDYVQLPVYETLRPLLEDFYSPPTENQIAFEGATVAVFNGTGNPNWDQVAAQRLQSEGFNAVAMGAAPTQDAAVTQVIDRTGSSKGSSLAGLARALNLAADQVTVDPAAGRQFDFEVVIGANYNSCPQGGVLPVDPPPGT